MMKLLSCKFNMDTNRVEAKFADGTVFVITVTSSTFFSSFHFISIVHTILNGITKISAGIRSTSGTDLIFETRKPAAMVKIPPQAERSANMVGVSTPESPRPAKKTRSKITHCGNEIAQIAIPSVEAKINAVNPSSTALDISRLGLIIAAFIFVIALFGTSVVRKCASTLSVLILIGLGLVLVPNIIVQWDAITAAISNLVSGKMPVISGESGAFGPALYSAVLYFFFQLASVSVMYQHMEPVTDKKQINKAAIEIFVFNFFAMELSIIGLLAVAYAADLVTATVPMLVLVQNGVSSGLLTPIISVLIILGSISTAVNMISGIVTRCVNAVERRMRSEKERQNGHLVRNAIATLIFTFLAFAIAQFGLLAVVKQGYAYLGYAAFITLFIPFIIHVIVTKGKEI